MTGPELRLKAADLGALLCAVTRTGRCFKFTARGTSMHPLIRDRDVVVVAPLSSKPVSVGEVVAMLMPPEGRLLIHRVVARRNGQVYVQGDASPRAEGPYDNDTVKGRVTRVERGGRDIWFGNGAWGRLTAFLVRTGAMSGVIAPLWRAVNGRCRSNGDRGQRP